MKNEQSKCRVDVSTSREKNDSKSEFIYNDWGPIHRIYAWIRANEDNKTVSIYRQKNKILTSAYRPYTRP